MIYINFKFKKLIKPLLVVFSILISAFSIIIPIIFLCQFTSIPNFTIYKPDKKLTKLDVGFQTNSFNIETSLTPSQKQNLELFWQLVPGTLPSNMQLDEAASNLIENKLVEIDEITGELTIHANITNYLLPSEKNKVIYIEINCTAKKIEEKNDKNFLIKKCLFDLNISNNNSFAFENLDNTKLYSTNIPSADFDINIINVDNINLSGSKINWSIKNKSFVPTSLYDCSKNIALEKTEDVYDQASTSFLSNKLKNMSTLEFLTLKQFYYSYLVIADIYNSSNVKIASISKYYDFKYFNLPEYYPIIKDLDYSTTSKSWSIQLTQNYKNIYLMPIAEFDSDTNLQNYDREHTIVNTSPGGEMQSQLYDVKYSILNDNFFPADEINIEFNPYTFKSTIVIKEGMVVGDYYFYMLSELNYGGCKLGEINYENIPPDKLSDSNYRYITQINISIINNEIGDYHLENFYCPETINISNWDGNGNPENANKVYLGVLKNAAGDEQTWTNIKFSKTYYIIAKNTESNDMEDNKISRKFYNFWDDATDDEWSQIKQSYSYGLNRLSLFSINGITRENNFFRIFPFSDGNETMRIEFYDSYGTKLYTHWYSFKVSTIVKNIGGKFFGQNNGSISMNYKIDYFLKWNTNNVFSGDIINYNNPLYTSYNAIFSYTNNFINEKKINQKVAFLDLSNKKLKTWSEYEFEGNKLLYSFSTSDKIKYISNTNTTFASNICTEPSSTISLFKFSTQYDLNVKNILIHNWFRPTFLQSFGMRNSEIDLQKYIPIFPLNSVRILVNVKLNW